MRVRLASVALVLVALTGGGVRAGATPPSTNGALAYTCGVHRDGALVALEGICVTAPDGTAARRLDEDPVPWESIDGGDSAPAWSPDGQQIAWVRTVARGPHARAREVFVMNADGSGKRQLTTLGGYAGTPAWSPDGKQIAFAVNNGIFVVDAAGGEPRLLVSNAFDPAWSPDGSRIAFAAYQNGRSHCVGDVCGPVSELYSMNADGTDQRLLSAAGEDFRAPSWSPDGGSIAVGCFSKLCIVPATGGEPRRLDVLGSFPSWSPDGKRIAFSRRVVHPTATGWRIETHVCAIDPDGRNPRAIAPGEDPDWQPVAAGGLHESPAAPPCPRQPDFRAPELVSVESQGGHLTARFGSLEGVDAATVQISTQPYYYRDLSGWHTAGSENRDVLTPDEIAAASWTYERPLDPGTYYVRVETRDYGCPQVCISGYSQTLSVRIAEPTLDVEIAEPTLNGEIAEPAPRFAGRARLFRHRRAVSLTLIATPLAKRLAYRVCWTMKKGRRCARRMIVGRSWDRGESDTLELWTKGMRPVTRFVWYVEGRAVVSRKLRIRR